MAISTKYFRSKPPVPNDACMQEKMNMTEIGEHDRKIDNDKC